MADKIRITPAELTAQAQKLSAVEKQLSSAISKSKQVFDVLDDAMSAKFTFSMKVKAARLMASMAALNASLDTGVDVARQCAASYENADKVIRDIIGDSLPDEIKNSPVSNQKVEDPIQCNVPLDGQNKNYTCGSASGSMILRSLGKNVSEEQFWNYANAGGQGTYVYRVANTLNHFLGEKKYSYVQTKNMSLDQYYNLMAKSIKNGYPVEVVAKIPSGTNFGYDTGGHYFVVTGLYQNEAGEYIAKINDPYSKNWYKNGHQGQQIEVKLSDIKKYNANHSGYVICNK